MIMSILIIILITILITSPIIRVPMNKIKYSPISQVRTSPLTKPKSNKISFDNFIKICRSMLNEFDISLFNGYTKEIIKLY